MQKPKKWHFLLIFAVILLTLYNILPTLFYYSKGLKNPVSSACIETAEKEIFERLDDLEKESVAWLQSFAKLFSISCSITIDPNHREILLVHCKKKEDALTLQKHLWRAGSIIPNSFARVLPLPLDPESNTLFVLRKTPSGLKSKDFFSFAPKKNPQGGLNPAYIQWILDRTRTIIEEARHANQLLPNPEALGNPHVIFSIAERLYELNELFKKSPLLLDRLLSTSGMNQKKHLELASSIDTLRDSCKQEKIKIKDLPQSAELQSFLEDLEKKETSLIFAQSFLKKHKTSFLKESEKTSFDENGSNFSLVSFHPLFESLTLDWQEDLLTLHVHPEFLLYQEKADKELKAKLKQFLLNDVSKISRETDERFCFKETMFSLPLHELAHTSHLLFLNLDQLVHQKIELLTTLFQTYWKPKHPEFFTENYPIVTNDSSEQRTQCLFIQKKEKNSLSITAKGIKSLLQDKSLQEDIQSLSEILHFLGFSPSFSHSQEDFVFEQKNVCKTALDATRENFYAKGSKHFAVLEMSSKEERLLAKNRIETTLHKELIQWRKNYLNCQIDPTFQTRFDVPQPTKSVFWNNLRLSLAKYLRGDERKIIRWGLDLSGGKTIQLELLDANSQIVKDPRDLKQGMNEIFKRVNKMGVSDASIRLAGNHIILDIPGSQNKSAKEILQSSTMYFHVVNEHFSFSNIAANRFLQDIWNEATLLNVQDAKEINLLAYKQLHADPKHRTEAAKSLYDQGLRLENPEQMKNSCDIDLTLSKIALLRDHDQNMSHPLLFVFANYALEGSKLSNVHASYDPTHGNYLSFEVKESSRQSFHRWTSQFSKEGSSTQRGWRMAVLLNDTVISAPTLQSALKESAMISGSFTPLEVSQLATDVKAGSLTFTPRILLEQNVSPELGKTDRLKGISATVIALLIVATSMIAYYKFSGLIASLAVLFNLFVMWATLQNLQATLSLAGLAGIILTVGMSVDANVLVFERIKEELSLGKSIADAIQAGYRKAFTAIIDSNLTSIIAALVLLNFDAGPVKGFAITLIIGIISSMFTALFLTKTFYAYWIHKKKNLSLRMSNRIQLTSFDFLRWKKPCFLATMAIIFSGLICSTTHHKTLLGMDFTGGFSTHFEIEPPKTDLSPSEAVLKALLSQGFKAKDVHVRSLSPATHLRVLFSQTQEIDPSLKIDQLLKALQSQEIHLTPKSLLSIYENQTSISGQMSDSMRTNAFLGLSIAFTFIFIYLAVRFEAIYATSAIFCLLHDTLITLGGIAILNALGVPLQIDLNTLAALMTVIGYSLNDTIIIFDRIREELKLKPETANLSFLMNRSLNATFSRTFITSGTTLLVLLALVVLGGSSIFGFALVMTIGVFFGTLSSWFIATPCLLLFMRRKHGVIHIFGQET